MLENNAGSLHTQGIQFHSWIDTARSFWSLEWQPGQHLHSSSLVLLTQHHARVTTRDNPWSGHVTDKVPSPYTGVRAAQLNR
jgi:hypothetical protein